MMLPRTGSLLIVVLISSAPPPTRAGFIGLGYLPGGNESAANGVSADGSVVVGYTYYVFSDTFRAIRWTVTGGMQDLGTLPFDRQGIALGLSGDGSIVAGESISLANAYHAFRWSTSGGMQSIDPSAESALAVSADGSVIAGGSAAQQAFRWTSSGGLRLLGTLAGAGSSDAAGVSADGSVVVGHSGDLAFRWTAAGGMQGLGYLSPADKTSDAHAISADGSVVVGQSSGQAVRWTTSGGPQSLGAVSGFADGVSADGRVIVGTRQGTGDRAFVWDSGSGQARDLLSVLISQGFSTTGWSLRSADAITGDESTGYNIVGQGMGPDGQLQAYLVTGLHLASVPEPPSLALGGVAVLAGLGAWLVRRAWPASRASG
jgi:uncharacterized membrane protein